MEFERRFTDRLYIAESAASDRGFLAFVVGAEGEPPENDKISLAQALNTASYRGSFVFSTINPQIDDTESAERFLEAIDSIDPLGSRHLIWLLNPASIVKDTVAAVRLSADGHSLKSSLNINVASGLSVNVQGGVGLSADVDRLIITGDNTHGITFGGNRKPESDRASTGWIPCRGSLRGCLQYTAFIQRESLYQDLRCGYQILVPDPVNDANDPLSEWLPLIDITHGAADQLGFDISLDPCDPANELSLTDAGKGFPDAYDSHRTFLNFTGEDVEGHPVVLKTFYRTVFGEVVELYPVIGDTPVYNARLVISPGNASSVNAPFHLAPEGDFQLAIPTTNDPDNHYLACGLSGTEFFKVSPRTDGQGNGDVIRFLSRQPAYVANFPFPPSSPVNAPSDPTKIPFDGRYRTAWATIVSQEDLPIYYVSQPRGASLFGLDKLIHGKCDTLFGHTTPGFAYRADATHFFPLLPYSGLPKYQAGDIRHSAVESLENTVIAPWRRLQVAACSSLPDQGPEDEDTNDTTPSGLIASLTKDSNGQAVSWDKILLGQNTDNGEDFEMSFVNPGKELIEALQSSDVFLVAADQKPLGDFRNRLGMGSWIMEADVGTGQSYGNYRNVMILKGRKGKLYDHKNPENSLVANPQKWTQATTFAIPSDCDGLGKDSPPDAQLVMLSQWLQTYFEDAQANSGNPYFKKFNSIAAQDSWTGVLFLRVHIDKIPQNLAGITAGITQPERFNAHHLAIDINPVVKGSKGAALDKPSSVFGLIYYVDPAFNDKAEVPRTVAPDNPGDYDFRLLSLKVLFENTAVKSFESYAQLTLNKVFDSPVARMRDTSNIYNNVLLSGSLQLNNGQAVYSLESGNNDAFYLDSNVINKVDITDVILSTRSPARAPTTECWFSMSGFIDFRLLSYEIKPENGPVETVDFDLYSFGSPKSEDLPRQGLNFSNLGVRMQFPETDPPARTLDFSAGEISFDLTISTPRTQSLYNDLSLNLDSLQSGSPEQSPKENGYLDVIPDLRLGGVNGQSWYGLRYKLNMGSPGALAGKIGLDSYLLLSWSPETGEKDSLSSGLGIELPGTGGGAKLISLQNVMKLSIGMIRLKRVPVSGGEAKERSFLLMFTEIALKFLGLAKIPPNGSTLFYLFGNPQSRGKPYALGWYAMYRKNAGEKEQLMKLNDLPTRGA